MNMGERTWGLAKQQSTAKQHPAFETGLMRSNSCKARRTLVRQSCSRRDSCKPTLRVGPMQNALHNRVVPPMPCSRQDQRTGSLLRQQQSWLRRAHQRSPTTTRSNLRNNTLPESEHRLDSTMWSKSASWTVVSHGATCMPRVKRPSQGLGELIAVVEDAW